MSFTIRYLTMLQATNFCSLVIFLLAVCNVCVFILLGFCLQLLLCFFWVTMSYCTCPVVLIAVVT